MIQVIKKWSEVNQRFFLHVIKDGNYTQVFSEEDKDRAIEYAKSLNTPPPPDEVVWEQKD